MSLIAKIQQQSLLQNKLQAQLADRSYQAINGTRQSARISERVRLILEPCILTLQTIKLRKI